jgi:hypothetical protein
MRSFYPIASIMRVETVMAKVSCVADTQILQLKDSKPGLRVLGRDV